MILSHLFIGSLCLIASVQSSASGGGSGSGASKKASGGGSGSGGGGSSKKSGGGAKSGGGGGGGGGAGLNCFHAGKSEELKQKMIIGVKGNCATCSLAVIQAPHVLIYAPECESSDMDTAAAEQKAKTLPELFKLSFSVGGLNFKAEEIKASIRVCKENLCNKPKHVKRGSSIKGKPMDVKNPKAHHCYSFFTKVFKEGANIGHYGIVECPPDAVGPGNKKFKQQCILITLEYDFTSFQAGCYPVGTVNETQIKAIAQRNHRKGMEKLTVVVKPCTEDLCNGVPYEEEKTQNVKGSGGPSLSSGGSGGSGGSGAPPGAKTTTPGGWRHLCISALLLALLTAAMN